MRSFLCMMACAATLMTAGELSGRRAPGFSLIDVNFKQHDPQDYRGKILLVELMQTGCPHCAAFSAGLSIGPTLLPAPAFSPATPMRRRAAARG